MLPSQDSSPKAGIASRELLAALWQRGLPRLRERLEELDAVAASAVAGTLAEEVRTHAAQTAHKLAGSLGMFGFWDGTNAAREIEVMLEAAGAVDGAELQALASTLRASLQL